MVSQNGEYGRPNQGSTLSPKELVGALPNLIK